MRTAGIREARQNLSALLDEVKKGHEVVITEPIVLAPNTSDIMVKKGQQLNIAWRGFTGSSVIIYLYKGSEYLRRVVELTPNDGHFSWTVPSTLGVGGDYKIKILSAVDSSKFDFVR